MKISCTNNGHRNPVRFAVGNTSYSVDMPEKILFTELDLGIIDKILVLYFTKFE